MKTLKTYQETNLLMKRFLTRIVLCAAALLSVTFSITAQTPAADDHKLSPSEVKTLIRGASTPEDHLKLAAYFRQEALDETASAKLHVEMVEGYEPGSAAPSMFKQRSLKEMQSHCREFARNANRAAEVASKMAAEHEKMAEMMRTAPPQTRNRSR